MKPLFYLLLFTFFTSKAQITYIHSNWKFKEINQKKWNNAKVPGEIYSDLLNNKLIEDPYFRDNEKKLKWVEKKDWEYQTTFSVDEKTLKNKNIDLVFDGLDTYATIFLNGKELTKTNNMFIQWRIPILNIIKKENNQLRIVFKSAQNVVDSLAKKDLPFIIPDNPRAYVRKAQYHFGWDWGPKFTTCGIWKNIYIDAYNQPKIEKKYIKPIDVQLIQKPDEIGRSFYFQIDGKPVYMKGANYIPSDAFLSRMTKKEYEKVISMAKDANMNMLRVWGGGIYEDDYFYDLCDKNGIYIWQDFMFAGTMNPGDKDFFDNVRKEIKYQVKRLRHHKSIVLWCGNNENDEAFFNWGWQKSFKISKQDSLKLYKDYTRLFQDSIPKWVKEVDPFRPYIPSSPLFGWGKEKSITQGDSHYWGIWWGTEDVEKVQTKTGRFVSEYGMISMPNYSSIEKFTNKEDRFLYSDILKDHLKAGNGFKKLNSYLHRYLIDSTKINKLSVKDYTYLSQVMQHYTYKNMIGTHRLKSPQNMGTLLWQLNDCWPVTSWSIIDYYNRQPKASWYAVKEAYRDDKKPEVDFTRPKDMKLENPEISYKLDGNTIIIKTNKKAKYIFIDIKNYTGKLSDNYFDLSEGEQRKITIEEPIKNPKIEIISLFDILNKYKN